MQVKERLSQEHLKEGCQRSFVSDDEDFTPFGLKKRLDYKTGLTFRGMEEKVYHGSKLKPLSSKKKSIIEQRKKLQKELWELEYKLERIKSRELFGLRVVNAEERKEKLKKQVRVLKGQIDRLTRKADER